MTAEIRVVRLPHAAGLPLPAYATAGAAGLDLLAAVQGTMVVAPGERALVPTGLLVAVPPGHELQVRPRSGLALRHGIVLPNSPGTIDEDYRGELQVIVMNLGDAPFAIERGMRVAQAVLAPVTRAVFREVASLDETERGAAGFGSTGTKGGDERMLSSKTPDETLVHFGFLPIGSIVEEDGSLGVIFKSPEPRVNGFVYAWVERDLHGTLREILYIGGTSKTAHARNRNGHKGGFNNGKEGEKGFRHAQEICKKLAENSTIEIWARQAESGNVFGSSVSLYAAEEAYLIKMLRPIWNGQ